MERYTKRDCSYRVCERARERESVCEGDGTSRVHSVCVCVIERERARERDVEAGMCVFISSTPLHPRASVSSFSTASGAFSLFHSSYIGQFSLGAVCDGVLMGTSHAAGSLE